MQLKSSTWVSETEFVRDGREAATVTVTAIPGALPREEDPEMKTWMVAVLRVSGAPRYRCGWRHAGHESGEMTRQILQARRFGMRVGDGDVTFVVRPAARGGITLELEKIVAFDDPAYELLALR